MTKEKPLTAIQKAAQQLGRIKTIKKAMSSRQNGKLGGPAKWKKKPVDKTT